MVTEEGKMVKSATLAMSDYLWLDGGGGGGGGGDDDDDDDGDLGSKARLYGC